MQKKPKKELANARTNGNAIAKANSSRVQPLAIVIGGRNRPIVWRTPMASIRMSAAQASTARVERGAVMGDKS